MEKIRKKQLAKLLSKLESFKRPKVHLEQYRTPGDVAAELLWIALNDGNITDKVIADLGAGTGIISIGASLLGARKVYALEIDEDALDIARKNAEKLNIENIIFLVQDISEFNKKVDTVIMNPPFGCQREHADRTFLEKAFEIAQVVYSIHISKEEVRGFLKRFSEDRGFSPQIISSMQFEIPAIFFFHEKRLERIKVDLYRFSKLIKY